MIHAYWKPVPGTFDDYIATPKDNFYQSLHTAVIYDDGRTLEVQIRTPEMHENAEYGIAAHWRYKEGRKRDEAFEQRITWLRRLMEWRQDVEDASEFVDAMKSDVFEDRVYVFTPKGDIIDLPASSTPDRLRLSRPHRYRPPLPGRQGQRQAGDARLPAADRRLGGDPDRQARRAQPGLAEPQPRDGAQRAGARQDPPVVQAPEPRAEHLARPAAAGQGTAPPGSGSRSPSTSWRATSASASSTICWPPSAAGTCTWARCWPGSSSATSSRWACRGRCHRPRIGRHAMA